MVSKPVKHALKFLISLAIGLAVFLIVMAKVGLGNIRDALALFFNLQGLAMIGITLLFAFFGIYKWRLILRKLGHKFSLRDLSPLWLLGFSLSYITPFAVFGGEIFRIYFTRKRFPEVNREKAMASVAIDKILDATVFFVFLIVGLLTFAFYGRFPSSVWGVGVVIIAGGLLLLLGLFYFKRWQKQSALEWLLGLLGVEKHQVANGSKGGTAIFEAEKQVFHFFSFRQKALWQGLGLTFLRYGMLFLRCIILIVFLTGTVGVLKPMAVYGFANLASLTPMPATLGTLELGAGFAFKVLGFGFSAGTIFGMVWRGADLLLVLIGLIFVIKFTMLFAQDKLFYFFKKK